MTDEYRSEVEAAFAYVLRVLRLQYGDALPEFDHDYRFDETRKWETDFAFVSCKVAFEIEGGTYSGGRHVRGKGYEADCEKYNAMTLDGWQVFRLTTNQVNNGYAYGLVSAVFGLGDWASEERKEQDEHRE